MLRFDDPLPLAPCRILIAGVSGSGKSTTAARIGRIAGVPYTEIDALYHGPGWTPRPEFAADVATLVAGDAWVTEWLYRAVKSLLISRAQLLVWLDVPFWTVTLPRVTRRTVRRRRTREELWNGNVEPPLSTALTDREHIVRWAIATRHKLRVQITAVEAEAPHLAIVRLRSPREVEEWLAGPHNGSITLGA